MRLVMIMLCFLAFCQKVFPQKEGNVWAFGDSTGIDFNDPMNPQVISSSCFQGQEAFASICDKYGNLLIYSNINLSKSELYNGSHQLINNSNNLKVGETITQGILILPLPEDTNTSFVFHIGVTRWPNVREVLYYSIVDMSYNQGLGEVILKNQMLLDSVTEKMQAVRHSNGKDWWIIVHKTNSKEFYTYLLNNDGIADTVIQSIGPSIPDNNTHWGQMKFSPQGDKLLWVDTGGRMAISGFDRCTGMLYNWHQLLYGANKSFYGCSFSASGRFAYVTANYDELYQFDLTLPPQDIIGNAVLLYSDNHRYVALGQHMLAPNGKIYISNVHTSMQTAWSSRDSLTTHLTVIEYPDSFGTACNVQPYSFSLNGYASYTGLPNMPNYNLGPVPIYALDTPQLQYTICKGDSLPIGIADTMQEIVYSWQEATGAWQSTEMLPVVAPQTTTTYYLTRTDTAATYSCNERYDTITVFVNEADSVFIDTTVMAGTVYWGNIIHADTTLIFTYKRPGQCDSVVVHDVEVVTGVAASPSGGWGVRVWPNPANDKLYIVIKTRQVSGNLTGLAEAEFALYNVLGEKVRVQNLEPLPTSATSGSRIDVSGLPEGIYLWRIVSKNAYLSGKIVVQ